MTMVMAAMVMMTMTKNVEGSDQIYEVDDS